MPALRVVVANVLDDGLARLLSGTEVFAVNVFSEEKTGMKKRRFPEQQIIGEEVCLKAYGSIAETNRGIGSYVDFYNRIRPHQSLENRMTPDEVYFGTQSMKAAA